MEGRRLGRLEVLGAWLGVWTPPRGAIVPPVPWRPIAIAGTLVALDLLAGAVLLVPASSRTATGRTSGPARPRNSSFAFCRVVPLADKDRLAHPLPDACPKRAGA